MVTVAPTPQTSWASEGHGPTIVLVHGLGLNQEMWRWQAPSLSGSYRVITYDLIGHGESPRPPALYSIQNFVDQLDELSVALELDSFALVGFSLGGLIAQAFAVAYPERVRALAVLHSAHARTEAETAAVLDRARNAAIDGPGAMVEAALDRWFTPDFAQRSPNTLRRVAGWIESNDPVAFAAAYRVLVDADAELVDALHRIACPTLVVTGSEDHGNSPEMAQRMATVIQGAECRVLAGLRHMALVEDPQSTLDILLPFLGRTIGDDHS